LPVLKNALFALLRRRLPNAPFELAAIALLWALYLSLIVPPPYTPEPRGLDSSPLVDAWLNPDKRQPGVEHERLAGTLLPVFIGLERYGQIPTWNPYLSSGKPIINNPFSYLFNPFYSLPVLLLGGVQGSKLATALALLLAGWNMWALARAIGAGAVGRVTAGALYMMSGGLAAKFFTGHFQLGLSLAWVPLVFAGLWWTLHSRDRRAPILMAAAFALLFTSGNIYYTLHTLVCSAVIFAVHVVERSEGRRVFRWDRLRRVALGAAFAVGLSALQFFPVLATARYIIHDGDPGLVGRYSLAQAAVNLIHPWDDWGTFEQPIFGLLVVVDYNYIGPAPFLLVGAAGAVGLARRGRSRKYGASPWLALGLALAMMVWGAGQTPIIQELYANIPLLAQFRYVGRALAVASLWWIVLAGLAAETLWETARRVAGVRPGFDDYDRARLRRALAAGTLAWVYFLVYSLAGNSTRLGLALGDYGALNRLDAQRFTSFTDAAGGLWVFLLAALLVDSLLLALAGALRRTLAGRFAGRDLGARALRLVIFALIAAALADIMQVNSQLLPITPLLGSFRPFYEYAHQADPDSPFPAFQEPYLPMAFDAYEMEVRNWGLSEGWRPGSPPGLIPPEAGTLTDLPRWLVVSNVYGGASRAYAENFAEQHGFQQRRCMTLQPQPVYTNPCDLHVEVPFAAVLYELPSALPYAFVAPADILTTAPGSLQRDNVLPVERILHRQDTIAIQAERPAGNGDYYLVVRETHFPGWTAAADGLPVETVTLETNHSASRREGFIGVRLLPGRHTYTLRYQPPGLAAGVAIFLATLALAAFYLRPGTPTVPPINKMSQPDNPAGL
jgi:hypothetical protein